MLKNKQMKKIFSWIVLIVAAIAFVGCTKNGGTEESSILGTWRAYRWVIEFEGNIVQDVDWSDSMHRFKFKENGELEMLEYNEYSYGNYFISGDQLIWSTEDATFTDTIRTLTETELVLERKLEEDSLIGYSVYYFTRIG